MKRIAFVTALVAAFTTAILAERFVPASGSMIRIEGTSTLDPWTMEGSTIDGQVTVAAGSEVTGVAVVIPVTSIKSGNELMDRLMAAALDAKTHPEIRYQLTSATLRETTGPTVTLETRGKLTIAGVTRDLSMDVAGTRTKDGRYVVAGQVPVRMTDYGLEPPVVMMNTIKTGDEVKVTFRWVVAATR